MALGVCTPRTNYHDTDKGLRANQLANMGQPISNPRRQGPPQKLRAVRGSSVGWEPW
jgi:hypothetical protein